MIQNMVFITIFCFQRLVEREGREAEKQKELSEANKQLDSEMADCDTSLDALEAFDPATVPLEEQEEALKRFEGKGWADWLKKWRLYWLKLKDKYPEESVAIDQQLALLDRHEQRLAQAPQTARQRTLEHLKQRFYQQAKEIDGKLSKSEQVPVGYTTEDELKTALEYLPTITDDFGNLAATLETYSRLSERWTPKSTAPREMAGDRTALLNRWDQEHLRIKDYLGRLVDFNAQNKDINEKIHDLQAEFDRAGEQVAPAPVEEASKKKKKKGKGKSQDVSPPSPQEVSYGPSKRDAAVVSALLDKCHQLEPQVANLQSAAHALQPLAKPRADANHTQLRFTDLRHHLHVSFGVIR